MGVGSADYYLRAVARSTVDYYMGHGEAPGYWIGAGSARLGLAGEVSAEQLRHMVYGRHPGSGIPLAEVTGAKRRPGFDITFSAPKSASVLYALGDEVTRTAVRRAHDAAVADAVGYLERVACKVRRGKGGVQQLDGAGFVAAAFRQRTSRAGDPHLHTQVVTANMTAGPDGRWTALDGRLIYLYGKTAGTLYRASLRWRMAWELGARWVMRPNGLAEIDGVPAGLLRRLSQRRQQVEQRMADRGERSAGAAQVATLATRARKDAVPSFGELLPTWRQVAGGMGFDGAAMRSVLGRGEPTPAREAFTPEMQAGLLGPTGLTEQRSSFGRLDVLQALCRALPDGAPVEDVERLADELVRHRDVIPILPVAVRTTAAGGLSGDQTVRTGGRPAGAALTNVPRYTTVDLLAAETAVLSRADSGRNAGFGVATSGAVEAALARRPSLSDEQRAMVRRLTTSGALVDVVVGRAGAGKTYALDAAREAWQMSGYTVVGAALAARAAAELHAHSAIPSVTLTRLLGELEETGGLPPNCVLVVDEAGMVGTRAFDRLTAYAEAAGAKLVPVGDPRQIPEIEAGGILRALIARQGAVELLDNRRQIDPWEQVALDELRHGDVATAIVAFDAAGSIVVGTTDEQTRALMVAGWWRHRQAWEQIPPGHPERKLLPMMRAYRRADVADFNARGRAMLAATGRLSGPEIVAADGHRFAVGDSVALLKNKYRHGLLNGDVGQVVAVDVRDRALLVQLDRGQVRVPAWYLDDGYVTYGYARTIHTSQGETGYTGELYGSEDLLRELAYTGLSRARHRNTLYLTVPTGDSDTARDPYAALRRGLARSGAQTAATDLLAPEQPPARLDLRRHTDNQLAALVAAGERVERNQPPDVRGRLTAVKNERDWLARRLAKDRDRIDRLRHELDAARPFARAARRELRERIDILNRALTHTAHRVDELDEQLAGLAREHAQRLAWEQKTRHQRDTAHLARDELDRRAPDRRQPGREPEQRHMPGRERQPGPEV